MPEIKIQHITSVSSEDKAYPSENLIKNDGFKKWKCLAGEKQAVVVFQFEKAVEVKQIDIGNEGSAFIEVLVGKSTSTEDDYEVILVASSFMSPSEARANQNPNRVRIFSSDLLSQAVISQKWDRAKVICTQPFNKTAQYGLSFIKFHSTPAASTSADDTASKVKSDTQAETSLGAFRLRTDDDSNRIRTGLLFERSKSKIEPQASPASATGAAAIRAASKIAEQSMMSHQSVNTSKNEQNGAKLGQVSETTTSKGDHKDKTKEARDRSTDSPPPVKKPRPDESGSHASKPFGRLMSDVVFVLSGFQNPDRGNLRDAAIEMGATFKPDWSKACTHLICAFEGTPKYEQVSGHGCIVKKTWITDCHSQKKLLPWRKYRLGRAPTPVRSDSDTEEEDVETVSKVTVKQQKGKSAEKKNIEKKQSEEILNKNESDEPKPSTSANKAAANSRSDEDSDPFAEDIGIASDCDTEEEIRRFEEMQSRKTSSPVTAAVAAGKPSTSSAAPDKNTDVFNASTDEETLTGVVKDTTATDADGLPVLPDFFSGKTFLLYGKLSDRRSVVRFITAYNGRMADYMDDTVKYVITDSSWDDAFDKALSENPDMVFVRSDWISACHNSQKCVPHQKFAVVAL